MASSQNKTTVT